MSSELVPEQTIKDITVVWRLVLASLAGVLAGCSSLWIVKFLLDYAHHPERLQGYGITDVCMGIIAGFLLFPFGLIVTTPLLVPVLVAGKIFEKSINAHPAIWSISAFICLWFIGASILTFSNNRRLDNGIFMKFVSLFQSGEGFVLLFGFGTAALTFYSLSTVKGREMLLRWQTRKKALSAQK